MKELENYFLVPEAVQRVISTRAPRRTKPPSLSEICERLDELCARLRESTTDALATEILGRDRKGLTAANKAARAIVDSAWKTLEQRWAIVSGKDLISGLSKWSQEEFGVSFGPGTLATEMAVTEIHPEVRDVIDAIERGVPLS